MRFATFLTLISLFGLTAIAHAGVPPTTNRLDGDPVADGVECIVLDSCVQCPADGIPENEDPCYDWYAIPDIWNGGCNSDPPIFQILDPTCEGSISVCGWGGTDPGGMGWRDTDWYEITLVEPSQITVCVVAEIPVNLFIIDAAAGCATTVILHEAYATVPCEPVCIQTALAAGTYWLWVGANDFYSIPCGQYLLTVDGYYPEGGPSATERTSWSTMKNQYK